MAALNKGTFAREFPARLLLSEAHHVHEAAVRARLAKMARHQRQYASIGVCSAFLALMLSLWSTPPASAACDARSAAPLLIGVRGSGEAATMSGLSPQRNQVVQVTNIGSVAKAVHRALVPMTSRDAEAEGLSYPAIPVKLWDPGYYAGGYTTSVALGVKALIRRVKSAVGACRSRKIIIIGYSQGAQVFHDAEPELSRQFSASLAAVVLFGDPRFRPESYAAYGSYNKWLGGIRLRGREFSEALRGKIRSYCHARDIVCQRGSSRNDWEHRNYPDDACDAARFIKSLVDDRARSSPRPGAPARSCRVPLDFHVSERTDAGLVPLAGVTVVLRRRPGEGTGPGCKGSSVNRDHEGVAHTAALTDGSGVASFSNCAAGDYSLSDLTLPGYQLDVNSPTYVAGPGGNRAGAFAVSDRRSPAQILSGVAYAYKRNAVMVRAGVPVCSTRPLGCGRRLGGAAIAPILG